MAFDTLTLKAAADIDMSALDDAKDAVDDFADHFESELEDIDDRVQTSITVDDVDTSAVEDALRDRYTLQANILPPTAPEIPDAMLGVDKLHFQNQVDDLEPQFVDTFLDVQGILREGFSADTNPNTNAGFRGPDGSFAGAEDAVRDTQLRDFIAEMGEDSLLMGLLGRGNGIPLGDGGSADADTSDLESILPPGMSLAGGGSGSEASPDNVVSLLEQLSHQSGRPANKTLPGTVEGMTFDEAFMEGESFTRADRGFGNRVQEFIPSVNLDGDDDVDVITRVATALNTLDDISDDFIAAVTDFEDAIDEFRDRKSVLESAESEDILNDRAGRASGFAFQQQFGEGESVADGQIPMRLLDELVDSDALRSEIEELQKILADERDFTGEQLQQIIEDDNLSTGQTGLLRNLVFDAPFGEGESFEDDAVRDDVATNMGRLFGDGGGLSLDEILERSRMSDIRQRRAEQRGFESSRAFSDTMAGLSQLDEIGDDPLPPVTGLLMGNALSRRVFDDDSRRRIDRKIDFEFIGPRERLSRFVSQKKLDDDEFDGFFDIMREVNFSMRDYLQIVTDLLPVFGVFVAAIPAAVASLISLAAAATAVIGAFGAIAGLGLMGFIMQDDGTLDFQILKDELRETAEAFVDAFAPLARRFAPLIADFFERTRAIFDDLARAASPLTQFTDEFRDVFDILESALPALLSGAIQLAQATLPLVIESLSFIADIDFFELFGQVIASTLPIMAILFRRIIALLPTLVKLSLGFLQVATAIVTAVVGVLNFLDAFGPLLPIFAVAIALILTTVTVLSLLQTAMAVLAPIATAAATSISILQTGLAGYIGEAIFAAGATFSLTSALYALAFVVTLGGIAFAFVTLQQQISGFREEVSGLTDDLEDLDSVSSNMTGFGGGLGVGGTGTGGRGSIYVDNSQTVVNGSGRASILTDRTDFGSETSVYSDGRYHNT